MHRSKSAFGQKNKKQVHSQSDKTNKKQIQINTVNTINPGEKPPIITDRPQTSRNTFEQRLNRIRQGFQSLEKNLTYRPLNQQSEQILQIHSELTSRKLKKRLFPSQSLKKTAAKRQTKRKSSKKISTPMLSSRGTPKNSYHSCLYEKSLLNLMKIVIVQKDEIKRLNNRILTFKRKG